MTNQPPNETKQAIDAINGIARGFMGAQVLFEAHAAGVFPLLEEPRTADCHRDGR